MNDLLDLYENIFSIDPYERLVTKILIKEAEMERKSRQSIRNTRFYRTLGALLRGLTSPALYGSLGFFHGMKLGGRLPERILRGFMLGTSYSLPFMLYSRILPQAAMEHALKRPILLPLSYYLL